MFYNDYYGLSNIPEMLVSGFGVYTTSALICLIVGVLAVILGVVLFFTVLRRKNEGKFTGTKGKLYDFLNVNKFYTEDIIRLFYVITVCVVTLVGLAKIILGGFFSGLFLIVLGNIITRVSYECLLMFFVLVRKTVAIDKKLAGIEKFYGDDFSDGCCGADADDSGFGDDADDAYNSDAGFDGFGDDEEDGSPCGGCAANSCAGCAAASGESDSGNSQEPKV